MRKLIEALASWQGPKRVGEEIALRGFKVPSFYQHEMAEYCHAAGMDSDLENYWSECAKERIFSGGRADPMRRGHLDDAPYRSAYLDQLMAQRQLMPPSRVPELHPCLRHWIEEKKANREEPGRILWDKIERFKYEERERHGIPFVDWSGKKRGTVSILRRFAEQKGFVERDLKMRSLESGGKAWCQEKPSGLVFYCWVDTGGLQGTGARLPLYFDVFHAEDGQWSCGVGPNTMSAGADYYAVFKSPENAVYGIYALVEIFDAFVSTFG